MPTFDRARFRATHNSYSGGDRGSIPHQLDAGIRGLELDVHDNGFSELGDFRVGHLKPCSEVALGNGNPDTARLRDWLAVIARWSDAHPPHAPITLVLDAKGDFTDAGGDLSDLNTILADVLGPRLFTRDDFDRAGRWPDVDDLRGRILCVLSGHGGSRLAYRWAFGTAPALAANAAGRVALAYQSTTGDLNGWTGAATPNGVDWERKSTYGFAALGLKQPAVALGDDGWMVVAHRLERGDPPFPLLESRVGRVDDNGRIRWFSSEFYANGHRPGLQMSGNDIREIHDTQDGTRRQQILGTLNRQRRKIEWRQARTTTASPFALDSAQWAGGQLVARVGGNGVIECGADRAHTHPVRLRQLAFVEAQRISECSALRDALFFAATAADRTAIAEARQRGLVVRAWSVGEPIDGQASTENIPATDTPDASWYARYMTGPDVVV